MNYKDYLKKSLKVEVRINGLSGTTHILERPKEHELKSILKDRNDGIVTFVDEFFVECVSDSVVSYAELWYGSELMATRQFPDTTLLGGDTLTLTFALSIERTSRDIYISV